MIRTLLLVATFCFSLFGQNTIAQSLDETVKYVNTRIHLQSGYVAEVWVDSIGLIRAKWNAGYESHSTYASPFDLEVKKDQENPKVLILTCKNEAKCITSINDRVSTDVITTSSHPIVFSGTFDQIAAENRALSHLIELAKQIYSEHLILIAKSDPFMAPQSHSSKGIKMTKLGNVYEVPVELNGVLKIKFILDTGAGDVFLSPDIAITLKRTGTLSEEDYIGTTEYSFANGKTESCRKYKLRSIKIGDREVNNVVCAVANSFIGDMLLGQSFLNKLGSFKIDYSTDEIIIE